MKNKLLSVIMVSALALQIVACGATEAAKAEGADFETVTEAAPSETQETAAPAEAPAEEAALQSTANG